MEDGIDRLSTGRTSRRSQVLALLLAAVLLVIALRGANWQEMLETLRRSQPGYLAIACIMTTVTLFIRGLRWRILLSAEKDIAVPTVFWATSVGYLGNNFLPARAGELIRSVMLGRVAHVSKSLVLATALTERLMDVVVLVVFGLLAVVTLHGLPEWLLAIVRVMGIVGVLGMVGIVVVSRLEGALTSVLMRLPLPKALGARLTGMMGKFLLGMRAFQNRNRALGFVGLTIVIWLMDGVGAIITARALDLPPLNLLQALLLLAGLGLSSAVPSTPGYVGVYQFVAVTILPLFSFTQSQALAYVIVLQALAYAVVTVWGLLGLWRLSVTGRPKTTLIMDHGIHGKHGSE